MTIYFEDTLHIPELRDFIGDGEVAMTKIIDLLNQREGMGVGGSKGRYFISPSLLVLFFSLYL